MCKYLQMSIDSKEYTENSDIQQMTNKETIGISVQNIIKVIYYYLHSGF